MEKKIDINMLSAADIINGQGVGSAYLEQVNLIREEGKDYFNVFVNSNKNCDIIHCHTIEPKNYFRMKKNKGINVSYVHFLPETLDGSIKLPKIFFNVLKKYVIKFYKCADYIVVVNPTFIKPLVKYGIVEEKINYIPNYVSKDKFYPLKTQNVNMIRDKYGIDKNRFVVLGVGQVQTRKGVLDFIEVAKKNKDIDFIWCGGFSFGKITDGYEELKKVYDNPPENVKFLGIIPREEMNDIYNACDVLFMPSFNELFPMAILEAVNSHKPLLLRNLELYENILFFKYLKGNNVEDFSKIIKDLKDDKKLYKKYSIYSKEISEYYSKENILKIWIDFYTKIYNNNKK